MKVKRQEVIDYETYKDRREAFRSKVLEQKDQRRVHVGDYLTFLFENHDTMLYQIQEMVRAEQMVREADIQHEIETYNEVLGDEGELACTLLIEIDDRAQREILLKRWRNLPEHVYVRLENDEKIYARYDPRQVGEDRLSSVQYLKFATGGRVPVAVGTDHEQLSAETKLTPEQREALARDLAG
jgi:hypothetical protein